ncbi:glycoside hydrolase family 20 protein [Tilletiaria anomala UBC 951]|uniref:Beta-hexosaminidase n=1 Tax=Tilletiaria anomala (strain ATCC 24038 / CBS 436.72 / UBC 951) TaxID=1037660 RepID=A0A066VR16_TILAU|nr:glycoside hydrolase family 20 protein [Tilletiaria anomala UBC 951]KDN42718.1 glycoside hydrolase family 20 protein [Tilletiaria anomala UBC 951]
MKFDQALYTAALYALCSLRGARALWPQPASMTNGSSALQLNVSNFQINLPSNAPLDLQQAAERSMAEMRLSSMQPLVVGRGAKNAAVVEQAPLLTSINVAIGSSSNRHRRKLSINQVALEPRATASIKSIYENMLTDIKEYDESYTLDIPADGTSATLSAATALGALRGLTTLQQLIWALPADGLGSMRYLWGAPFHIEDKPAFPYRGLLLDTSRNYFSIASLKHLVDTMTFVKMNQFHWHITDAQSWPLALDGDYAFLSQTGAYSPAEVYTKADIADFVQYAGKRGVNVNVEIDMPGHEYMGVSSMPGDLVACGNQLPWTAVANEPPSGQLRLGQNTTDKFVAGVIEQTAAIFPGKYFSTGGDEINLACYGKTKNSDIDESLLKPFLEKAHAKVADAGKIPMVWEEMAINFPATGKTLRNGTIVETWTNADNVKAVLQANPGVDLIHAPSTYFYLDCGRGVGLTGSPSPSWCTYVNAWDMYAFDPLNGTQGVQDGPKRVLGGEAALWTETVFEGNLDTLIWPRTGAVAEVFWTGASYETNKETKTRRATEAAPRLNDLRYRMVERGVAAQPLVPHWCALRPDRCPDVSS